MFWEFPLKIQTLNTTTNEVGYRVFETKKEFTDYVKTQFKLPGEYNLKNTIRWQDVGEQYSKTVNKPNFGGGYYTRAVKGTHQYKKFWHNEKDKVKNGIIIDDVFIPPFYYWYLNFCPIHDAVKGKKRFGDVWDSDLWFFHYIMLCMLLGKHAVVLKARQRGYSFKIMAILYWSYSWNEGSINTIGAHLDEFTLKSWRFVEFYRNHLNTNTWWKRGPVLARAQDWLERIYLTTGGYVGWDSKLSATTFKVSPENGVGGSQTIFFYEEAGIAPTILTTIGYVRPAIERGNVTTGIIIVSGSVGDLDDAMGLKELFYNPEVHNFLAMDNIWDKKTSAPRKSGMFVSEAYSLTGFMDENGNSLVGEATAFVEEVNVRVRNTKARDLAQLDISQKPLSPEDAFAQRKKPDFPIEELQRQQDRIKLKDQEKKWLFEPIKCVLYEDDNGKVQMKTTNLSPEHHYPINPEWDDKRGVVTIFQLPDPHPKWLTNFAGVDTVEVDFTTTSDSIMSVDIYQRSVKVQYKDKNGKIKIRIEGGKIIANYRGRYDPVEKGNEQAWFLIKLYNAFTYVERSKPNFINYMKRHGRAEKYLAKEVDVPIFKDLNIDTSMSNSNYGFIIPSRDESKAKSQMWQVLKSSVKEYMGTEFDRHEKDDGEVLKIFTGIDRMDDFWLLEEYIQYDGKKNTDRIISSAAAITIGKVYENEHGIPTINEVKDETPPPPKIHKSISMIGGGTPVKMINPQGRKGNKPISLI